MDYRFANTADIVALSAFSGGYYSGRPSASLEDRERLCWERFGSDHRVLIFEDEGRLAATLVYRPTKTGFDLEEFIVDGSALVAAEAFRLLLDEILAPRAKIVVQDPGAEPEAVNFWRSQGFETDRITLASSDGASRSAANQG